MTRTATRLRFLKPLTGSLWLLFLILSGCSKHPPGQQLPEVLEYWGRDIVLSGHLPNAYGPGAQLQVDVNGDRIPDRITSADQKGFYILSFDATALPTSQTLTLAVFDAKNQLQRRWQLNAVRRAEIDPADSVPQNLLPAETQVPEPAICSCSACPEEASSYGASLALYSQSFTPGLWGVELATGKLRHELPITAFETRLLGFDWHHHHATQVAYDGPWGQSFSHSFNMMIVRLGDHRGQIVTPDLRIYPIDSRDGVTWNLPPGFFSELTLNQNTGRWTLTHFEGLTTEFYLAAPGLPGYPISVQEPNGNTTRLTYGSSGQLRFIHTDLKQEQQLTYGSNQRLAKYADHLGRTWHFSYDPQGRLISVTSPVTTFADLGEGEELTDRLLAKKLVTGSRKTTLTYDQAAFPDQVTAITDQRGATPQAWSYDPQGRVGQALINGKPVTYNYQPQHGPTPLPPLDPGNTLTRVVDREGNTRDYEIHGPAGGPVMGTGKFGLRRLVNWTERGKGNPPLRPDEPRFWEQRWRHDCDCLRPETIAEPFPADTLTQFDGEGIPTAWPRTQFTYNRFRQPLTQVYTDGRETIRETWTYQPQAFGRNQQYSRMISWTEPRAFDESGLYQGLDFVHNYAYDGRGNQTLYRAPKVTRGQAQTIAETWVYNGFGQVIRNTDANGNLTSYTYHQGPSSGGDINSKGTFGGYLASITFGDRGSADPETLLTTRYLVNPLGMTTRQIDPKGFIYDSEYNDLMETVREVDPQVALLNDAVVRYETRSIYDGAGHLVMSRRSNQDETGKLLPNPWNDRAMTYDAVGNTLSLRVEIDADEVNDLITRYAYDGNDQLTVVRYAEGNGDLYLYDERKLPYKHFYGVAAGERTGSGYPKDKRAEDLGGTSFVGLSVDRFDARGNLVATRDGRGFVSRTYFDFYNRPIAFRDPNGNGWTRTYDDASLVVTATGGSITRDGRQGTLLKRSYTRWDEFGRPYQTVLDIDLAGDESALVDPDDGANSSFLTGYDPGTRVLLTRDANGNITSYSFDAADRTVSRVDAAGNRTNYSYDANNNVTRLEEVDVPGPGASGLAESYITTFTYDALHRNVLARVRGLNGNSIDHRVRYGYDSRNNQRIYQDEEGRVSRWRFDDFDRKTAAQRFDRLPAEGAALELARTTWAYDRNSRKTAMTAFGDVRNTASAQVTRLAYDDLDRPVVMVYPDSDDPVSGGGNGPDGRFDRWTFAYDANSNLVRATDQRGVVHDYRYDPGNRLFDQRFDRPEGVPGMERQTFAYDALNRTLAARNDYAEVSMIYDPLSRLLRETQAIRLDGSGFSKGWEQPISVQNRFDRQSNRLSTRVGRAPAGPLAMRGGLSITPTTASGGNDLRVDHNYDNLNRVVGIRASYFGKTENRIAEYAYLGPGRVQNKTLGNGARLTQGFDGKRRVQSHRWQGQQDLLVGFSYGYDRVDNTLFEGFNHDRGRRDHFTYNARHEIATVRYQVERSGSPGSGLPGSGSPGLGSPGLGSPSRTNESFVYDDLFNRVEAAVSSPFRNALSARETYTVNPANEVLQITRNGAPAKQTFDAAGNPTRLRVLPAGTTSPATATARWDAFNALFDIAVADTPKQHYRYDALRRRIAAFTTQETSLKGDARRFIYDGWEVVTEEEFLPGATTAQAPSRLERIHVMGPSIDEPLLTAIDGDGDGQLNSAKNRAGNDADREYYRLTNRQGHIMALLDADDPDRVLEYYRHTVFGLTRVLPVVDADGDGREDTPNDLSDNIAVSGGKRVSDFGNVYLFAARRFDGATGLYYNRNRYYEPLSGRFLNRDPIGYDDGMNLYAYVKNRPTRFTDPMGTAEYCAQDAYVVTKRKASGLPGRPRKFERCIYTYACPEGDCFPIPVVTTGFCSHAPLVKCFRKSTTKPATQKKPKGQPKCDPAKNSTKGSGKGQVKGGKGPSSGKSVAKGATAAGKTAAGKTASTPKVNAGAGKSVTKGLSKAGSKCSKLGKVLRVLPKVGKAAGVLAPVFDVLDWIINGDDSCPRCPPMPGAGMMDFQHKYDKCPKVPGAKFS